MKTPFTYIFFFLFFFNDTPTTEIYTLSLHDALPISPSLFSLSLLSSAHPHLLQQMWVRSSSACYRTFNLAKEDRKSTRLNSSHPSISYAVFCLKKKIYNYCDVSVSFMLTTLSDDSCI